MTYKDGRVIRVGDLARHSEEGDLLQRHIAVWGEGPFEVVELPVGSGIVTVVPVGYDFNRQHTSSEWKGRPACTWGPSGLLRDDFMTSAYHAIRPENSHE